MLPFALLLGLLTTGDFDVEATDLTWKQYRSRWFDTRWVLEPLPAGRANDFLDRMTAVAEAGELGDLIARVDAANSTRDRVLAEAPSDLPVGLLRDDLLASDEWDPDEDSADDGIVHGPSFDAADIDRLPWNDLSGNTDVHTAAILIRADLEAIKTAENDYRRYFDNVDSSFEEIYPVRGAYVRGEADGRPFAGTAIRFTCDLPFPFTTYSCDLRTLNRLNDDGHLVTDVYSVSEDLYWLAGRDVCLPVKSSDGVWVATLMVRMYGFDLSGVPDSEDNRKAALRSGLGHLKRRAERLFEVADVAPRTTQGAIPEFEVRGRR